MRIPRDFRGKSLISDKVYYSGFSRFADSVQPISIVSTSRPHPLPSAVLKDRGIQSYPLVASALKWLVRAITALEDEDNPGRPAP